MSGGHFHYKQYLADEIAEQIENLLSQESNGLSPGEDARLMETAHTLRQAVEMVQRVDWLLCGDDSEETFHERWRKEVRPYWNEIVADEIAASMAEIVVDRKDDPLYNIDDHE